MKRKIVLAFLTAFAALSLCLALAACNNGANTGNTELGGGEEVGTEGLQYQKRKDEAGNEYLAVVGLGTAWDIDIVIPSSYRGFPVKVIGESAFSASSLFGDPRNEALTSISIPDSVTTIGDSAFSNCIGLTEITIPDSVTEIADSTFYGCSGLTEITIPDSVTSIGERAFWGCSGLTEITIPDSVTSIGERAFWGCSGLTEITIPDSVITIGDYAFEVCSGLTNVTIGNSVTMIGGCAFRSCSGLEMVVWNAENCPQAGVMFGEMIFEGCTNLHTITIGETVKIIPAYAFCNCSWLTEITIPDSVTEIGDSAFSSCGRLTNITIGSSVTSIGKSAFSGCRGLTEITIPDSVTSIGEYAFWDCKNLESVTFRDPTGWSCSGTELDATALQNPTTAAVYFTKTYCDYTWTKNKSN